MREEVLNIWDKHTLGHPICITTNGCVNRAGACVMGRGVAKQAAIRFPKLPRILGAQLQAANTDAYKFVTRWHPEFNLFSFPVKYHWSDPADLELIASSANLLVGWLNTRHFPLLPVYLPRPGCGNGRLSWSDVKPVLQPILDNRIVVVTQLGV